MNKTNSNLQNFTLEDDPIIFSTSEAAYIASALSTDKNRKMLSVAALVYFEDAVNLVSTDSHRLHVLRLADAKEPFETKTVDIKRLLFEARFSKRKQIFLTRDLSSIAVGDTTKKTWEISNVYAPIFDTIEGKYLDVMRVIPKTKTPQIELFGINSKYLIDALRLAHPDFFKTVIFQEGRGKPLLFQPAEDKPRWRSIIMPMYFNWEPK
jgi:DNA polymerase III sliding clamp (beta) subunit (PCNA family)